MIDLMALHTKIGILTSELYCHYNIRHLERFAASNDIPSRTLDELREIFDQILKDLLGE